MVVLVEVSVIGTGLDVSVRGTELGVSVVETGLAVRGSEVVVGGREVCVRESVVEVEDGGVKVPCPLHAAMNNTNKSINRFIS